LSAAMFSQRQPTRTVSHVRRVGTGKTLKLGNASLTLVSSNTAVRRRVGGKSSHVRRLTLSQRR
jgi:hypothetical protein